MPESRVHGHGTDFSPDYYANRLPVVDQSGLQAVRKALWQPLCSRVSHACIDPTPLGYDEGTILAKGMALEEAFCVWDRRPPVGQ